MNTPNTTPTEFALTKGGLRPDDGVTLILCPDGTIRLRHRGELDLVIHVESEHYQAFEAAAAHMKKAVLSKRDG